MSEHHVHDEGDERKYFTRIPNLIDDYGLSVYAFRLYGHLKRVAGDSGKCWQSTRTLADACNMSVGMVSKAKEELKQAKFIRISKKKNKLGGKDYHEITITDIWPQNMAKYATSSQDELASSPHERSSSPDEIKKNIKENINGKKNKELIGDTPICKKCGVAMVIRNKDSKPFWGCMNFGTNGCREKEKYPFYDVGGEKDRRRYVEGKYEEWIEH